MKLTLTLSAFHDYDGNLCLDASAGSLGAISPGGAYDAHVSRDIYDPGRNYMAEQAVLLERLSKYVVELTSYYSGRQTLPQFPEVLRPARRSGKSERGTQPGGQSPQS